MSPVISYGLWQRRFGGATDILHRKIRLDGVNCNIIGVMPRGFGYPTREVEVWAPIQQIENGPGFYRRGNHQLYVLARVRDSISIAQATAEVSAIQHRIWIANPGGLLGRGAVSLPLREITTRESKTSLYVLLAAVGCLLLIACVNISNLLLARGSQRSREFAVRSALGASRSRLLQQLLTESVLLAAIGAIAGLLLAYGLTQALGAHASTLIQADDIDTSAPIRIDGWVLSFTLCVSLFAGIAASLLPARRSAQTDTAGALKEGGRTATARKKPASPSHGTRERRSCALDRSVDRRRLDDSQLLRAPERAARECGFRMFSPPASPCPMRAIKTVNRSPTSRNPSCSACKPCPASDPQA